jgi:Arc/MetJ-type ribon-helix-helix transcriptional regulator
VRQHVRYDASMTAAKIAITLPEEQLARVRRAVRDGRAASVSGYIHQALAEQERRESLDSLVRDLIAAHGEPTQSEVAWAKRALARRRRRT